MHESVQCRLAETKDLESVKQLWHVCFDDSDAFVDWYFAQVYDAENTLCVEETGALVASLQLIPYEIALRGSVVSCGYVVGVDTLPEARHKGHARRLLQESLRLMRERQQAISLLMPFEGQFYYRYGWPYCYFHQQVQLKPGQTGELRCAASVYGNIHPVDLAQAQALFAPVYDAFIQRYDGWIKRSKRHWEQLLADWQMEKAVCYVCEQDGMVQGYFVWLPLRSGVRIPEFCWQNDKAKAGLLQAMMEMMPPQQRLTLDLPADDALVFQLAADKEAVTLYPFLMARVVDVAQCLTQISYPNTWNAVLRLAVQDPFAPWNHGVFALQVVKGAGVVQRLTDDSDWDVQLSIMALSQLIFGVRTATQLAAQGELSWRSDVALQQLQALFPAQQTYNNEYY